MHLYVCMIIVFCMFQEYEKLYTIPMQPQHSKEALKLHLTPSVSSLHISFIPVLQHPCGGGGGDVSEYSNSHIPTQTPEEDLKWLFAITRLTVHCCCGLMNDLVICKCRKRYGHTYYMTLNGLR